MADAYPAIDEFGPGSCTCQGTMTGCAVCACANLLVRYGKPIPRLPGGTPDMRALGRRMGARHRAAVAGNRHGTSLDGHCTGGTNWCTYCIYLELKAAGLPVAHGQRSWTQIVGYIKARLPVALPGLYGKVPYVFPTSYSEVRPARGRSDAGFGGTHMMVAWAMSTASTVICSDSDFGSPSRPILPPHSVLNLSVLKSYWTAVGWSVCYMTKQPPSLAVNPKWGTDIPANIKATDPTSTRTVRAFLKRGKGYGSVINMGDLTALFKAYSLGYGTVINPSDMFALFHKARV